MSDDDDVTPHLGRIGDKGKAGGRRASTQLRRAVARQGRGGKASAFTGARYGKGGAATTKARATHHLQRHRMRRVIVKVHIAKPGKSGVRVFGEHLRYIQRDGVDRNGKGGEMYDRDSEGISRQDILERSENDPHQFRLIVSAEDGMALGDLKPMVRELMEQMERDLGRRLDWVAVDHYNTGHPHTHIVIRGRDLRMKDVVIAKDYLTRGIREAAEDIVTARLGPRRDLEIMASRQREVDQDRMTAIDRALERSAVDGVVRIDPARSEVARFERHLKLARLRHLELLHLARKTGPDTWTMRAGWTESLKAMARRGDIVRSIAHIRGREAENVLLAESLAPGAPPITGTVANYGPEDELRDTRFLLVEDFDGRIWHVPSAAVDPANAPRMGAVVEVRKGEATPKRSDRTIAGIAERTGGVWSEAMHAEIDPGSTAEYRLAHKRRLEALRRVGIVERLRDGTWQVPENYLEQVIAHEAQRGGGLRVKTLSWMPLDQQQVAHADTWLDGTQAAGDRLTGMRAARTAFLRAEGVIAQEEKVLTDAQRAALRQKELQRALNAHMARTGRAVAQLEMGERFEGKLEGILDLAQGRMAIVGNERAFALVPWRDNLGRQIGREMAIERTTRGIGWTIGRTHARGIN